MPAPVEEFFTVTSISSLGVAAVAVNVTANALYRYGQLAQKKTAFVNALILAYLNVFLKPHPHWAEWLLAFVNGCLLFCTAMGINDVVEQKPPVGGPRGLAPLEEAPRESFFSSWH